MSIIVSLANWLIGRISVNVGDDVANSGSKVNYVFAWGNGVVYIYNNAGVQATIPQKYFVTPNVKK